MEDLSQQLGNNEFDSYIQRIVSKLSTKINATLTETERNNSLANDVAHRIEQQLQSTIDQIGKRPVFDHLPVP